MSPGIVYLVGAGPGDPALLTLRARQLLDDAEVIAYDALCSEALLASLPAAAERLAVGRRHHERPSAGALHPVVLARAQAGRRVVRLKAGDPLVFGRGGEEAAALRQAGIRCELVPGISSALGAAAAAGIPLTQRGVASAVTLATGHQALERPLPTGTLVLYMATQRLGENLTQLVAAGRDPATPAAYVAAATTPRQQVVCGTLADLAARVAAAAIDETAPALLLAGEVVRLREEIAGAPTRPLWGRRLVVGRARPGRSPLAERLRHLGAEVVEGPDITSAAPADWRPLEAAFAALDGFGAVVFADATAVDRTLARLGERACDWRRLPPLPLVAVGEATAAALRRHGLWPQLATDGACAAALRPLAALRSRRLLLVADEGGRPALAAALRQLDLPVHRVAAHAHRVAWRPLWGSVDLVIAPSSSAARHLGQGPWGEALRLRPWLAIGPKSEAAVRATGARQVATAARDDLDALLARTEELLP